MKSSTACFFCLLTVATAVNPMQQVYSLLAEVKEKVVADGEAEDKVYANYTKFCVKTKRDLGYEIEDGEKAVEEFTATIEKASSDIDVSTKRAQELLNAIDKNEADLTAALDIRKKEKADNTKAVTELEEASDTLGRAIKTLSAKLGGSSLLQQEVDSKAGGLVQALSAVVDAASFASEEKENLMALVQSKQPPAVPAYVSQSGGIIQSLEDLKAKAKEDLEKVHAEEEKAQHSFSMLQQSLTQQTKFDKKELAEVKATQSEAEEEKAQAEGALDVSSKDLANDKTSLEKLEASCTQADTDYQAAKSGRDSEVEVIDKAVAVLKEKTGAAQGQIYKAAMLMQVGTHSQAARSSLTSPSDLRNFEAVQLVRSLAKKSKSTALLSLASNIESMLQQPTPGNAATGGDDVFAKVKQLIADMITTRQDLAAKEATKQQYCIEEKAKTEEKLSDINSRSEQLQAKLDKKTSEATTLKSEADTLKEELAELAKTQMEMDETRKEEKAIFEQTQKDLTAGVDGVRSALQMLREFYEGSDTSSSLIQQEQPTFGYSKAGDAATGILGMLEVVESDMARNLAEAETTEAAKAEDYEQMTKQNKVTKLEKSNDQIYKEKTSAALMKQVGDVTSDKEAAQEELDAILKYKESLEQSCLDGHESYQERVARQKDEIQGLKDALKELAGADLGTALLQSGAKGLRGAKPHVQ